MDYEISISDPKAFLYIRINVPVTSDLVKTFIKDAIRKNNELELEKLLIDVRGVKNIASTWNNYNLVYRELKEMGFNRGWKIAILVSPEDSSHDFIETLAKNAGYHCKLFREENRAIEWLSC